MFGWEFPPHISGGLGTACHGLTQALTRFGHRIFFVIPRCDEPAEASHLSLISASGYPLSESAEENFPQECLHLYKVNSPLAPYLGDFQYKRRFEEWENPKGPGSSEPRSIKLSGKYGPNLLSEVLRYGWVAGAIAREHSFDIIHAHDWMAVQAGLHARRISGKPLLLHIHALEFDRSGERINQEIYRIERHGMHAADHVLAVSEYTKRMIVDRYGVDPGKVSVVYNAVAGPCSKRVYRKPGAGRIKTVLFLGRITYQKGPEYFIEAAARVLKVLPEVKFVMAGAGDRMGRMIERVAELGIGRNFHFTGFLHGADVERMFAMSDLYVMPSVSEPFGISPLEALRSDVPVIISRQSGVSEILCNVLKVNFWDISELADKIVAVLKYPALVEEMMQRAAGEIQRIRWEHVAARVIWSYRRVLVETGTDPVGGMTPVDGFRQGKGS